MSPHRFETPEHALEARMPAELERVLDGILLIGLTVGLAAVAASFSRIPELGFRAFMAVHGVAYLVVAGAALGRKRLSYRFKAAVVVGVLWAVGLGNLLTLGLAGFAAPYLLAFPIFAGIFFGHSEGVRATLLSLATLGAVWAAVTAGVVDSGIDVSAYVVSAPAWAITVALTALLALLAVDGVGRYERAFLQTVRELEWKKKALEQTNEILRTEIELRARANAAEEEMGERLAEALRKLARSHLPMCGECSRVYTGDGWVDLQRYALQRPEGPIRYTVCDHCVPEGAEKGAS